MVPENSALRKVRIRERSMSLLEDKIGGPFRLDAATHAQEMHVEVRKRPEILKICVHSGFALYILG